MKNLREVAENDLSLTLEDSVSGGGQVFTIVSPSGTGYTLAGGIGDVGFLLDTDGNAISGRTITATFRMSTLSDKSGQYITPGRGWTVIYSDMSAHEWILYVTRFEPDRTLGIGRLILSLELGSKIGAAE